MFRNYGYGDHGDYYAGGGAGSRDQGDFYGGGGAGSDAGNTRRLQGTTNVIFFYCYFFALRNVDLLIFVILVVAVVVVFVAVDIVNLTLVVVCVVAWDIVDVVVFIKTLL